MSPPFGIYFHLPFCIAKCPYCDFASMPLEKAGLALRTRYLAALRTDLELTLRENPELRDRRVATIYFGGGTPSLLPAREIGALIARVRDTFEVDAAAEITLECNPAGALSRRLEEFRGVGVNRISLGVQSFQADSLAALGRLHSVQDAENAMEAIRSLGFASWGIDLIFAAPGSTLENWERDLERAIASGAPHLSVYGLTLHEGTALYEAHAAGRVALPDEETQRAMFLLARQRLCAAGYEHYEISNYALPGHRSRHNSLYWTQGEYLGLGAAAHSYWGARRSANSDDIEGYVNCLEAGLSARICELPPEERSRRGECIMLGLRQCNGVAIQELNDWLRGDFETEYAEEIGDLQKTGLLELSAGQVRLTEEGLLVSDSVFEAFF